MDRKRSVRKKPTIRNKTTFKKGNLLIDNISELEPILPRSYLCEFEYVSQEFECNFPSYSAVDNLHFKSNNYIKENDRKIESTKTTKNNIKEEETNAYIKKQMNKIII